MRHAIHTVVILGILLAAAPAIAEDPPVFLRSWSVPGADARGVGVDAAGNVYTTDAGLHAVFKFSGDGAFLGQIGGPGTGNGLFDGPVDVAIDHGGTMYVSDCGNQVIQVLDSNGAFVRQWPARSCGWLALDPAGQFICLKGGDSIYVFRTSDGVRLAGWAFVPPSIPSSDRGFGVGPSGTIYVATNYFDRVARYASNGTDLGSWGVSGTAPGQLSHPFALTVDANERVYVMDGPYRVQKFTADGLYLTGWGSYGTGDGQLGDPWDLAVDASGNTFVLEAGLRRVQEFGFSATDVLRHSWGSLKRRFR